MPRVTREEGERYAGIGLKFWFWALMFFALYYLPTWYLMGMAAVSAVAGVPFIAAAFVVANRLRKQRNTTSIE